MIIQVRGTSGSGKTTVMRRVMEEFQPWTPKFVEGRKKPLYYEYNGIFVLGHYEETACGGCDTIGSARQVFELIQTLENPRVVLCEGLLLSEDVKWSSQLNELRVLFLNTPLETCLEWIKQRREAAGNDKPLNPTNTANRVRTIERARIELTKRGIYCRRAPSEQAPKIILHWLKER